MPRGKRKKLVEAEPKEQLDTITSIENNTTSTQKQMTKVQSTENTTRSKNLPQEKVSSNEKDNAPQLILTYTDSNGKRTTTTFICNDVRLTENKQRKLMRSGPQTTLDIYIEASVIETL